LEKIRIEIDLPFDTNVAADLDEADVNLVALVDFNPFVIDPFSLVDLALALDPLDSV